MSFTHTRKLQYGTNEGFLTNTSDTFSGDGEAPFDGVIPISTDQEIDLAFPFLKVIAFMFSADGACTLRTNVNHTGSFPTDGDVLTLSGAGQIVWCTGDASVCPFLQDVTKIFIQNVSASVAVNAKLRVLLDVTV